MAAKLKDNTQRLFDLVRHQRHELFTTELITNDEYAELAMEHGSVDRLESYDEVRVRMKQLQADLDAAAKQIVALEQEIASQPVEVHYRKKYVTLQVDYKVWLDCCAKHAPNEPWAGKE